MAGNSLKPGHVADFTDSMAEAIEQAFREEWQAVMGTPLLEAGTKERQVLFSAIALGIVRHLEENSGAFEVDVKVKQTKEVFMRSRNRDSIPTTSQYVWISADVANVNQIDEETNRIKSEGTNNVSKIHVDD